MAKKKRKPRPVQPRKTEEEKLIITIKNELPMCPFVTPAGFALSTRSKDRRVEKGVSRKRKHKGQKEEGGEE